MTNVARKQRRARRLDDPRFERFRNPRARRRLVAILVILLVAEAVLLALVERVPQVGLAGLVITTPAFVLVLGTLKASTRGVEELPEGVLDERQAQLRGRVFATAYRLGAGLLTAALTVAVLWMAADLPAPSEGLLVAALALTFHITVVLPTLVAGVRDDL